MKFSRYILMDKSLIYPSLKPAATYSPTPSPVQYHQPLRS